MFSHILLPVPPDLQYRTAQVLDYSDVRETLLGQDQILPEATLALEMRGLRKMLQSQVLLEATLARIMNQLLPMLLP